MVRNSRLEKSLDFHLYNDEVIVQREGSGNDCYKVSITRHQYFLLKDSEIPVENILSDKTKEEIRFVKTGLTPAEPSLFDYSNVEGGRL